MAESGNGVQSSLKPRGPYKDMVSEAVSFNKSRKGTSRAAIHKFIIGTYNVGLTDKAVRSRLNATLKKLVLDGNLKKNKDSYNILSSSVKKAKTSKGDKPSVSQPKKKAAASKTKSTTSKKAPTKSTSSKKAVSKSAATKTASVKSVTKKVESKPAKKKSLVSSNAVKAPKPKRIVKKLTTKSPNTPKRSAKPSAPAQPKKTKKVVAAPKTVKKAVVKNAA